MENQLFATAACNLDKDLLLTLLPLFAQEQVDAIEWSFDIQFNRSKIPDWFYDLLTAYGDEGRLIGHGVYFSIFSGKWKPEQEEWLEHLNAMCQRFKFDHITEHFGFTSGDNFHHGAPLSIPLSKNVLDIGKDRLKRISQAAQTPIGLENLAFAYQKEDVKRQGEFIDTLLESVNGFMILDLHNLYCQVHNFGVSIEEIISYYPLDRVREIHISGGGWSVAASDDNKRIRRDTHDDRVPEEVFDMLSYAIPLCSNLKYVVLEQLGTALKTQENRDAYRSDFLRMSNIIKSFPDRTIKEPFDHTAKIISNPLSDLKLHEQQTQLSNILENASDYSNARQLLQSSELANTDWKVENWDNDMLATAIDIAQKWKRGFTGQ